MGCETSATWKVATGKHDRLAGLAAELVGLKVDVIYAFTTSRHQAAQRRDADEVPSRSVLRARPRAAVIALSAFRMVTLPRAGTPWEGKGAQRLWPFLRPFA
jgi:hypothetical protein